MTATLHEMFQKFQKRIPVIFDGAMGTRIQAHEMGDKDYGGHPGCNEVLTLTRPEVIVGIHKDLRRQSCQARGVRHRPAML
jgi:methionine synthase I (cobalamin-dependent)